jgi:hypothetical protein
MAAGQKEIIHLEGGPVETLRCGFVAQGQLQVAQVQPGGGEIQRVAHGLAIVRDALSQSLSLIWGQQLGRCSGQDRYCGEADRVHGIGEQGCEQVHQEIGIGFVELGCGRVANETMLGEEGGLESRP